jgi:hypothetical protein
MSKKKNKIGEYKEVNKRRDAKEGIQIRRVHKNLKNKSQ